MHFLYPAHPLKSRAVEPMYGAEMQAIRTAGFSSSLCPDAVIQDGKPLRDVPPGETVVYRGWMLNASEYERLGSAIAVIPATPLTSPAQYLLTHYLPNWYPLISEYTPETRILPVTENLRTELHAIGWGQFFVKDYVKSLKTSRGSILNDPGEIDERVAEMKRFRGEIEGGLCVRRVEQFIADSERRYFVLHGKPFSPDRVVPDMVHSVAGRISSPFFSIDTILRLDGVMRIVEVGDGQVSDLVGWTPESFAKIWT